MISFGFIACRSGLYNGTIEHIPHRAVREFSWVYHYSIMNNNCMSILNIEQSRGWNNNLMSSMNFGLGIGEYITLGGFSVSTNLRGVRAGDL